jgi:hypothetical protein
MAFEALAALEDQCINWLNHRRTLVTHVPGSGMFQDRVFHRACAEDLTQLVETDLFADIELNQHQNGAVERGVNRQSYFRFLRTVGNCE